MTLRGGGAFALFVSLLHALPVMVQPARLLCMQLAAEELAYLEETKTWGNVLTNFNGYSSSRTALDDAKGRKVTDKDRLFSLSSVSSPITARFVVPIGEVQVPSVRVSSVEVLYKMGATCPVAVEHTRMPPKAELIFELRGQAPPPSKHYHQVAFYSDQTVVFRTWHIDPPHGVHQLDRAGSTTEAKATFEEFLKFNEFHSQIKTVRRWIGRQSRGDPIHVQYAGLPSRSEKLEEAILAAEEAAGH
ncbi:uncharacterized protein MONBRDRAFT_26476 [Monosiga brevicollis MX1]|uniref:Uncharacterized protein n=1 Tax=Monosiga brevicollis TaxID=81824 RepID=A9V2H1_MONBE|nr:uncharacterized protein MONBRDRAFT_26476 [Monosiga brevicollis MX1]EDQ88376.1 predicted protein [Monosiga brevicollis MX1]|eukprot:XP_001746969.1 hypothetical protein [Monosiga brevicollis MX1]